MRIFKLMVIALVAMIGFNSCSKDCDHEFIEYDYNKALVGTWTCMEADYGEAMVINADGSFTVTGIMGGKLLEQKGTIKAVNNKVTLTLDNGEKQEGRLELVAGESLAIVLNEELDFRLTYQYCNEDLSDEIVGMWVCTKSTVSDAKMLINTYLDNGKTFFTGFLADDNEYKLNDETTYKVIGDLLFYALPIDDLKADEFPFIIKRLTYKPEGNGYGDIMEQESKRFSNGKVEIITSSMLRIRQSLDLSGMKYNYSKNYVTNVKGLDKDIEFMGTTFNFAEMDGVKLDKMLKMFNISFPDANTMHCVGRYSGGDIIFDAPIVVDGNKMTVKMSEKNAAFKDVDLYAFQDQDNTQFHIYMSTTAFVNFFGNMQVTIMEQLGQLDTTDAAAVKAVFDSIDEAVETINLSLVMTKAK